MCPAEGMASPQLNPAAILQTAFSFWSSKVLLTAVEFGLFTKQRKMRPSAKVFRAETLRR